MTVPFLGIFSAGQILTSDDMNQTGDAVNGLGLFIVKSQTVGNAVTSVTVSSAFSSDFDSYRIIYSGGSASAGADLRMTLGASAASYYSSVTYSTWAGSNGNFGYNNLAYWQAGLARTLGNSVTLDVHRPFLAERTFMQGSIVSLDTSAFGYQGHLGGIHNVATSYSAFTLTTSTGNITGGTIRVYGYRNTL
jgi:hypothetical protein